MSYFHSSTHRGEPCPARPWVSKPVCGRPRVLAGAILCGTLLLQSELPSVAQDTPISPIKIHGGAMTFFSTAEWKPFKNSDREFCVALQPGDVRQLRVEGFQRMSRGAGDGTSTRTVAAPATPANGPLQITSDHWRMELRGHNQNETDRIIPLRDEGMVMTASARDCNDRATGTPSVRLTTLGSGRFYPPPDLLPSLTFKGNKRFRSGCDVNSADLCERIAEINVYDDLPQTPKYTLNCADGACVVYVGKLLTRQATRPIPVDPGYPTTRQ